MTCFNRWEDLLNRLGCRQSKEASYHRLIKAYSEKHRAYHNINHIAHCLDQFDQVKQEVNAPDLVEAAIWYHDIIYKTRSGKNEEKSAGLAIKELLSLGVGRVQVKTVADLILLTKHQDAPSDLDAQYFIDCDLAILGAPPDMYDTYEKYIRKEYHWVPAIIFSKKREEVLKHFLKQKRIYFTEFFSEKYEVQARVNLKCALETLRN